MANFKGGFAFNNEAAKVEVEQSPNGALISCINPVTGESMGGGNPNSVQVIEGTLANPFGDVDINELMDALYVGADQTGDAHAIIAGDAAVLGFGLLQQPVYCMNYRLRSTAGDINEDGSLCNEIYWYLDGEQLAIHAYIEQNGTLTNIASYASQIPTTLTIYWHPMPETEGE